MDLLVKYDAFNESRKVLEQFLGRAQQQLLVLPSNSGRTGLVNLTEFLAQQFGALEAAS
jgi:hypothetical protein